MLIFINYINNINYLIIFIIIVALKHSQKDQNF